MIRPTWRHRGALALALVLLLVSFSFTQPPFRDDAWTPGFHLRGTRGHILAGVVHDGRTVLAGGIRAFGPCVAGNVVTREDGQWRALGVHPEYVYDLIAYQDELYSANHEFYGDNRDSFAWVRRWDGENWVQIGEDIPDVVGRLAVYQGDLYYGTMRWSGIEWEPAIPFTGEISAWVEMDGLLVFGGWGYEPPFVMAWDGENLLDLFPGLVVSVEDLAIHDGELHACVTGYDVGPGRSPVYRWRDGAWQPVGEPMPDQERRVYGTIVSHDGRLFLGGERTVYEPYERRPILSIWDGMAWHDEQPVGDDEISLLLSTDDGLMVCGRFEIWNDRVMHNAAIWRDGVVEPLVDTGQGVYSGLRCVVSCPEGLAVGGTFHSVGPVVSENVALWTGTGWEPRSLDPAFGGCFDLAWYEGALHCIAGRYAASPDRLHLRWESAGWQIVHANFPYAVEFEVWDDRLLARAPYVIFDVSSPDQQIPIATAQGGELECLTVWNSLLVAGGRFNGVDNVPAPSAAVFDGVQWSSLGAGLEENVRQVAVWNGQLVASGNITRSGNHAMEGLAVWDGLFWQQVGSGVMGIAYCLREFEGDLFLGGYYFRPNDGEGFTALTRWDGTAWHNLDTTAHMDVLDLEVHDGRLTIAGGFQQTGDLVSVNLASWRDPVVEVSPESAALPAAQRLQAPRPNPFNPLTEIEFSLDTAGSARLAVYDIQGRWVANLTDGWHSAGTHRVTWPGTDSRGRRVPSGTYLVRLRTAASTETVKATLVE